MNFGRRPCTIVQGVWPEFGAILKIRKKSNFDWNQLKLSTQHKYMYVYQKKIIKRENSHLAIFDEFWRKTMYYIVQGVRPDF